jgi:exonuclease SbcD
MLIAGNHDSGQRLSFGKEILSRHSLHICGRLGENGEMEHITIEDESGPVTFWLCPYIFPSLVAAKLNDDTVRDYDSAMRRLLERQNIDTSVRNVLVAHQNVVANGQPAEFGGSESIVGGVGEIDYTAFDCFDYVALGHIHSAYHVGRKEVRYAGTPLCYHFNETRQQNKGPILVELGKKGDKPKADTMIIDPLHRMRAISGAYDEIVASEKTSDAEGEYISINITDRRLTPGISVFFRDFYASRSSILMELTSSFHTTGSGTRAIDRNIEEKGLDELFADFIRFREGNELDEGEADTLRKAVESMQSHDGESVAGDEVIGTFVDLLLGREVKA